MTTRCKFVVDISGGGCSQVEIFIKLDLDIQQHRPSQKIIVQADACRSGDVSTSGVNSRHVYPPPSDYCPGRVISQADGCRSGGTQRDAATSGV